jgi:hypothetical protein
MMVLPSPATGPPAGSAKVSKESPWLVVKGGAKRIKEEKEIKEGFLEFWVGVSRKARGGSLRSQEMVRPE